MWQKTRSETKRVQIAKEIMEQFVLDSAPKQVNLESDLRKEMVEIFRTTPKMTGAFFFVLRDVCTRRERETREETDDRPISRRPRLLLARGGGGLLLISSDE